MKIWINLVKNLVWLQCVEIKVSESVQQTDWITDDCMTLTCPLCMDNSLWDPFTVKVGHLICEDHILDQQRTPGSCSLQVQFVPNGMATPRGQSVWPLLHIKSNLGQKREQWVPSKVYLTIHPTSICFLELLFFFTEKWWVALAILEALARLHPLAQELKPSSQAPFVTQIITQQWETICYIIYFFA